MFLPEIPDCVGALSCLGRQPRSRINLIEYSKKVSFRQHFSPRCRARSAAQAGPFWGYFLRGAEVFAKKGWLFCGQDGADENRAAVRRPQAISPAGCCLARGRIPPSPPEVADSNESAIFSFASSRERPLLPHHRMLYRYSPKKKAGFLQPSKRMYQSFLLRIFSSVSANLTSCSFVRFGLPLGCFPARRSFLFS